jgi:hypothetical protein
MTIKRTLRIGYNLFMIFGLIAAAIAIAFDGWYQIPLGILLTIIATISALNYSLTLAIPFISWLSGEDDRMDDLFERARLQDERIEKIVKHSRKIT